MDEKYSEKAQPVLVQKASGEAQPFDSKKLELSLQNAGAKRATIQIILDDIQAWVYNGVSTKKIYSRAFKMLKREKTISALRYKLKQAIMEMGPTGYPFEQFIGQIYQRQGYKTQVGVVVEGYSVTHEMDVIATKDGVQQLLECKYSQDQGRHVSVQVPLYVRSRVDDIVRKRKEHPLYKDLQFEGGVVTNTRFSTDSIQYGRAAGLHLLAWDYPAGEGLKDLIEKYKVYPLTVLTTLTKKEKNLLMERSVVSCRQLKQQPEWLQDLGLNPKKSRAVQRELDEICL
ncbi:MAG: restriction endonuclease [Bacteroidales bacterium]|nr:restriction endonuclease [Bacteroidales bacterium]MDD3431186.1 restriction endonuclease [Bacteroidales bacterium]MDD4362254.1 restriction endonuclease [Bacteroidales bacterium]